MSDVARRYGADPLSWSHFADRLGLVADLLPLVCNPNAVIAERSTLKAVGKTPSIYDMRGEVVGLGKWTERISSPADIARWSSVPDLGICVQARQVRAIDIDVPDPDKADAIEASIYGALDGMVLAKRYRENSGKRLLAFRYEGAMPKRVIPVDGGIVEFLGDGQQFVGVGTHDSGVPYLWDTDDGLPHSIVTLTDDELNAIWSTLVAVFATGEPRIAREKRVMTPAEQLITSDEQAAWLYEHWDVHDTGGEGQLFLRCPFEDEHTTDSGETSTAYFIAGTGGYERGHWVCLHGHCTGRDDHEFEEATGYRGSAFTALPAPTPPPAPVEPPRSAIARVGLPTVMAEYEYSLPPLLRDGTGNIIATATNLQKVMARPDMVMMHIAFDAFRDEIVWSPYIGPGVLEQWRPFLDGDYLRLRIMLERRAFESVGKELLREALLFIAHERTIDSAQTWLGRLRWDGVPRVEHFLHRYLGSVDSLYAAAVSRYVWSAMAGRVMEPGCQADMAMVLYGDQGERKTSSVKAMAPSIDSYTKINLSERDENLSRRLRGKLIGEMEELRGLHSRDSEAIKAWVSATEEEWIPKFREFGTRFLRRLLLIGTTNREAILGDDTGERRWLPVEVGISGKLSPERIARDREQLWAEGAVMFALGGIDWSDAERLAIAEHGRFKITDTWTRAIEQWLYTGDVTGGNRPIDSETGIADQDILVGAIGIPVAQMDIGKEQRVGRVMRALGFSRRQVGRVPMWFPPQ